MSRRRERWDAPAAACLPPPLASAALPNIDDLQLSEILLARSDSSDPHSPAFKSDPLEEAAPHRRRRSLGLTGAAIFITLLLLLRGTPLLYTSHPAPSHSSSNMSNIPKPNGKVNVGYFTNCMSSCNSSSRGAMLITSILQGASTPAGTNLSRSKCP